MNENDLNQAGITGTVAFAQITRLRIDYSVCAMDDSTNSRSTL